ncbi:unnamed protein product, partial [Staurois parvus]
LAYAHWAPGCQAERRHYRSWEDSAPLDRGTVRAGTCQMQSLVISCTVRSLWSSPVLCPQSLVISCTVRSLWSSPVLCPQSLVISCTVRSLWSSPVLCPQSLVISCIMSAVYWFRIFFFLFSASKT